MTRQIKTVVQTVVGIKTQFIFIRKTIILQAAIVPIIIETSAVAIPKRLYSIKKDFKMVWRVAPRTLNITDSYIRRRRPAATAPARTKLPPKIVIAAVD